MGLLSSVLSFLGLSQISLKSSQTVASDMLAALQSRDKSALRNTLWWPLRIMLTTKNTNKVFSTIDSALGPIESFPLPELHKDKPLGVRVVKSLVRFNRGRLGVTISLWGNKVVGFSVDAPVSLVLTPKWEAPDYAHEESFTEEEVRVRPYRVWPSVKGTLNIPKREGKKAAVLLIPGSGVLDRDCSIGANKPWKDLAYGLATAGFVVLRPDKPLPVLLFKHFVTKTITMHDEYIPHHVAALKYLARHPEVDPKKLFVVGASLGGRMAPRICAASQVPIAGMISLAGASRPLVDEFIDQLRYLQKHLPKPDEAFKRETVAAEEVKILVEQGKGLSKGKYPPKDFTFPVSMSYFTDDYESKPVEVASGLELPMLFMQGAKDWQVPPQDLDRWKEGLKGSRAEGRASFRLYDDIGHLFIAFKNEEKGAFQYGEPGHVAEPIIIDIVQWIEQVVG